MYARIFIKPCLPHNHKLGKAFSIGQVGATLYVQLSKESDLGSQRVTAISRTIEIDAVERAVQEAIAAVQETSRSTAHLIGHWMTGH